MREGLGRAAARLRGEGVPAPALRGKLLRPLLAYAAVPADRRPGDDDPFWSGALAIQMVHEASLLHDDIVDGAAERRGRPTAATEEGVARALIQGDHLLTAAYRAALAAGDDTFLRGFIAAVERTVAGEIRQARDAGHVIDAPSYREAIEGKSGELFGAATLLAATRGGVGAASPGDVGRRIGALYQMVDDVLDYCPALPQGKPAFQDLHQGKWTFILDEAGITSLDIGEDEALAAIVGDGGACARHVLTRLEGEAREIREAYPADDGLLAAVVDGWVAMAREGLERQAAAWRATKAASIAGTSPRPSPAAPATHRAAPAGPSAEAVVVREARAVGGPSAWGGYFGRHSKSFRFASRLFPGEARRSVEGVYAFCRFTDDLVDEAEVPADEARARLEVWRDLSRAAYEGRSTGVPLADHVLGHMAERDVPFHYADDLLSGVGMDLTRVRYRTLDDLELYTYRVASVVGGWITELFGVRAPEVLQRAYDMGHAMQLTNILRDVGEDWRDDRLYLPADVMERFNVGPETVERVATGAGPVPERWADLMESLMAVADRHYAEAFLALPELPDWYGRPVAVAARVYQGIHDEIRKNGYDNGTRRAWTRLFTKVRLGTRAVMDLRRLRREHDRSLAWQLEPMEG
ncbi:MAG TPA: squalene/phytoene synthase family protein [Polyangiaceae bacterium LLY-WYZ-14_1]|nr:squalene/phytoene synthase family protein [Polyangiaceae bacterium LLY-WYZ-14_1]